jgi:hypothetical protein
VNDEVVSVPATLSNGFDQISGETGDDMFIGGATAHDEQLANDREKGATKLMVYSQIVGTNDASCTSSGVRPSAFRQSNCLPAGLLAVPIWWSI